MTAEHELDPLFDSRERCDIRECKRDGIRRYWHKVGAVYLTTCDHHALEDWIGNE